MVDPTNRVALRQARDQAVALLSQRFAEDIIDDQELDERLERVERAETLEHLREVTADLIDPESAALVPTGSPAPTALGVADPPAPLARTSDVRDHDRCVALFGSVKRTGRWTPPRILTAFTALGETELDFREAEFPAGVTEVELQTYLGDVDILVPPGLPVEVTCSSILASVSTDAEVGAGASDPGAPRLRITGFAVLADIGVHVRLPGETKRDAKRRRKTERKALAAAEKERKKTR